ncbi:MAG TPA: thiosulfate oxidation carrier protein SoxY [Gammaproteobacteria bacterium]|nr:thiosulfate oxidation carrier protein SoxY [Gammaproteobacteria bacterium]
MQTNIKRRTFLKGSAASGIMGAAITAGLATPQALLAEWNEAAFKEKDLNAAIKAMIGSESSEESDKIHIKAPDIAENGGVVPVSITSDIEGTTDILILAPNNPVPMVAAFTLGEGAQAFARTNIKMGKTGDVVAVIKAGDKAYTAKKAVKVTIGGCGG